MIYVASIFLQPEATPLMGKYLLLEMETLWLCMAEEVEAFFTLSTKKSSCYQLLTPKSTWLVFPQLKRLQLNMHIEHITKSKSD
ncbi:hypothetical protein EVAR_27552_1 [Eumeta japonica]|uniref:Uncharacterized protein n=1 Tax=Eumeta variegata TaxID=151549 RepID=A0A4C1W9U0_EUMVA|nr:hypothetical protein EVAR_27552_1 [Eumeta japonica]